MKLPDFLSITLGWSLMVSACSQSGDAGGGQAEPEMTGSSSSGTGVDPMTPFPTTTDATGLVTATTSGAADSGSTSSETGGAETTAESSSSGATDGSTENCGNGVLDPGEMCDDGYAANSDVDGACTLACQLPVCGDGLVWPDHETCDLGPNNNDPLYNGCTTQCEAGPACNDGQIQGPEECDNGADNGTGKAPDGSASCDSGCRYEAKLVFVSSEQYAGGEIGGAEGAHLKCQGLAEKVAFDNHKGFKAFISDATFNPAEHFTHSTIPYVLPDGIRVADDWDDLVLEGPNPGITLTETSVPLLAHRVWTGTYPSGKKFPDQACDNWTNSTPAPDNKARTGRTSAVANEMTQWFEEKQWVSEDSLGCDWKNRLYCVEQ